MLSLMFLIVASVCCTLLTAAVLFTLYGRKIAFHERVRMYFGDTEKPEMNREPARKRWISIIRPHWHRGMKQVSGRLSAAERRKLDVLLRDAGHPFRLSAIEFRLIQFLLSISGILIVFLLFFPNGESISMIWLAAAATGALGFRYPVFYLNRKKTIRIKQINKEMPDFFDTVNVLIQAGMGMDGAISTVCQRKKGPLSEEFIMTLEDMKLGKSRREAFYELRKRVPSNTFQSIMTSLIQADQLGIGMANVLKNLTTRVREQQREAAREQAMKAPVKMLFPMVFFIFPALFIVILGPFVIHLVTKGLGG